MKNLFTEHPHYVGESYLQHMRSAFRCGFGMILGGLACLLHAFFPFLFLRTGSNVLFKQMNRFVNRMPEREARMQDLMNNIVSKRVVNTVNDIAHTENLTDTN